MKTFSTTGTGSGQTLSEIESDKIPIYDSLTDVEADLANLEENQIIATHDTGSELSAPVDTVQSGNMHAVTSNAVANKCCRFPDYAHPITISSTSWVATEDCYINMLQCFTSDSNPNTLYIDGNAVSIIDSQSGFLIIHFCGFVKKGQSVYYDYLNYSNFCKIFPLI